jgi:mono/diheme cytochrome c family protein
VNRVGRIVIVVPAALGLAGAAWALGGQNMVLGRQVPARPDAPAVAATRHARAHYVLHCAGCHGSDGAGSRAAQVPDMRRLGDFLRLPGGREFIVRVPGLMGSGLDDRQAAEVTNWVLETIARDSVPEGHVPFDAAEVARARSMPLADVGAERRRLVEQARQIGLQLE